MTDDELKAWEAQLRATPGEYAVLNPDSTFLLLPTASILQLIHEVQDLRSYAKAVKVSTNILVATVNGQ